jgi:hypothetical protein
MVSTDVDSFAALVWTGLGVSALLTWFGLSQSSWKALVVAAGLSTLAAIPLTWSIGPMVLMMASFQLGYALMLRRTLHWWTPVAIATAALSVWFATIVISATLLD